MAPDPETPRGSFCRFAARSGYEPTDDSGRPEAVMGRTNPTYREYLTGFESDCQPFRRGLRREYTGDFDRARAHADAAGYHNSTDPTITLLLSMLLAHEPGEGYDADCYRELALRAGETVLSPLGWGRDRIRAHLAGHEAVGLSAL